MIKKMVIAIVLIAVGMLYGGFLSANMTEKSTTTHFEINGVSVLEEDA